MKKSILLLLIIASFSVNGQSLKDALYGGKLRNDSNSVIRKGEDLSTKIDTTTKAKPAETAKIKGVVAGNDSTTIAGVDVDSTIENNVVQDESSANSNIPSGPDYRNNNKILKAYIDSLSGTLVTEVLPNKKIKKGTYYFYLDYEIGVDGTIHVNSLTVSPENETLENQVKERLIMTAPQLGIVPDSSGKPRIVKRKYNFNVTKDN